VNKKLRIASLSIISNTFLIILKVIAGVLSGSVSIISEAIHSSMDLAASIIAFFAVKESSKKADAKHPFGHGKIEHLSGLFEGVLILVASGLIILEAIKKLDNPSPIENAGVAIFVMLTAAVVNFFVSRSLYKTAKEEDSMALEADALHLKTDVYTALGVGVGLFLLRLTNLHIIDPLAALVVSVLIIKEALHLMKNAYDCIMDAKLDDEVEDKIKEIIMRHSNKFIDYHKLKTSKSGNTKNVDFHITLYYNMTVREAHDIVGLLKADMNAEIKNTRVSIHVDPSCDN